MNNGNIAFLLMTMFETMALDPKETHFHKSTIMTCPQNSLCYLICTFLIHNFLCMLYTTLLHHFCQLQSSKSKKLVSSIVRMMSCHSFVNVFFNLPRKMIFIYGTEAEKGNHWRRNSGVI